MGLSLASSAGATLIDPTTWSGCVGAQQCSIGDANLTAGPDGRTFTEKTVAGQDGLGISGGRTSGEIDIGETFNVSYVVDQFVSLLRIVFIYNGPEFSDVAEIAEITVNGSDSFRLSVSATSDNAASWEGAGTVANCGATESGGSGCFDILNPFGNHSVSTLSLTALTSDVTYAGSGSNQSDFSVGEIRSAAVPEPGTLSLLGAGLLGLGLLRRRQRRV